MTLTEFDARVKAINDHIQAFRDIRLRILALGAKKAWASILKFVDARIAEADVEREHLFKLPVVEEDLPAC